jgi:hypothetical protein
MGREVRTTVLDHGPNRLTPSSPGQGRENATYARKPQGWGAASGRQGQARKGREWGPQGP